MKRSVANGEATSLAALSRSPDYGARVIDILPAAMLGGLWVLISVWRGGR